MWKRHVVYMSRPHSVIVTFGGQLYQIVEIVTIIAVSLNSIKQCRKIISHTRIFSLFKISSKDEHQSKETSTTSSQGLATQHKQIEHRGIVS